MTRRLRYKEVQFVQFRSFCLAAGTGNFSTAADALGLSASTVWEQIRALEERLGAALLRRQGRAVEITADGQLLLDLVRPHVEGLQGLEDVFAACRARSRDRLSLATGAYILNGLLPSTLKAFAAAHPKVQVAVQLPAPFTIASLVERGEVDFALHSYDPEERPSAALSYEKLFAFPLQVLVPSAHPLARKKQATLADLVPYPVFSVANDTFSHRVLHRVLERHGLSDRLNVLMELSAPDAVENYVAQGAGIGLVYLGSQHKLTKGVRRLILGPALETLPFAFIARKTPPPTPLTLAFADIAREKLRHVGDPG